MVKQGDTLNHLEVFYLIILKLSGETNMSQWLSNDKIADHDFGGCILKFLLGMSIIFILILYPIYWLFFKKSKNLL